MHFPSPQLAACSLCFFLVDAAKLSTPTSVSSKDGYLETSVSLKLGEYQVNGATITAPLFNGTLPGPTFRLAAGDTINVTFSNELPNEGAPYSHNEYSAPAESNLHFHGLFVSGELPSDDAALVVGPGESYKYTIQLPENHLPGTHWLHPHRHGSTALQVGGGAAAAIIVEDPTGFLPVAVEEANEVLLLLQEINFRESGEVITESQAESLLYSDIVLRNRMDLVNGQVLPSIPTAAGEWNRLRFINAGWVGDGYALTIDGCEMVLLAKDGVYISDFPRPISTAFIFTGGRADILVRCPEPSTVYQVYSQRERGGNSIATIETMANASSELVGLEPWTPFFPEYLQDLRDTAASDGCSCTTNLDDEEINGHAYEEEKTLHKTYLGAVVERSLRARRHPYHQHTYPYQLVDGFTDTEYIKKGDWHDTFDGNAVVRYQPKQFATKVMLHCHKLTHEDEGMMSVELVQNMSMSDAVCTCVPDESRGSGSRDWNNRGSSDSDDEGGPTRWDDRSNAQPNVVAWMFPYLTSVCIALLVVDSGWSWW